ncbi:MAG: hypothetical protein C5B53_06780 [Candidatus Melainabacteria bacterium]|nr:MAG: hypothetical protein C5B53_06780 [Candidatus Melainabacteria bacterium]
MRPRNRPQFSIIGQTSEADELAHIVFIGSPCFPIVDVGEPFFLRRDIAELFELRARQIAPNDCRFSLIRRIKVSFFSMH